MKARATRPLDSPRPDQGRALPELTGAKTLTRPSNSLRTAGAAADKRRATADPISSSRIAADRQKTPQQP